jgi:hypothetical protein
MAQGRVAARWAAGWLAAVFAAGCAQILGADWVGSLPLGRGRWGQFDLSGNVSEGALDWAVDHTVPWNDQAQLSDVAADNQRTRQGGYYASDDYTASNAHRGTAPSTVRGPWTSARCARDLPP